MNIKDKAKEFAINAHKGQIRKSDKEKPMIIHPINVADILSEYGFDDNVVAAGYLHDVIEDTKYTKEDVLKAFNEDPETKAVMMIGEIGGNAEEDAAAWIKANMKKPVAAFISGQQAPPGKRMGHAGAIIAGGKGSAADKIKALNEVGIEVAKTVAHMGDTMVETLKKAGIYEECKTC